MSSSSRSSMVLEMGRPCDRRFLGLRQIPVVVHLVLVGKANRDDAVGELDPLTFEDVADVVQHPACGPSIDRRVSS